MFGSILHILPSIVWCLGGIFCIHIQYIDSFKPIQLKIVLESIKFIGFSSSDRSVFYALTHLTNVVSTLTNGCDKSKLSEITYLDVFGSELIYRQFPYLLKSCELWLSCASLDDSQRFDEAAMDAGIENSYGVITFWWEWEVMLHVTTRQESCQQASSIWSRE